VAGRAVPRAPGGCPLRLPAPRRELRCACGGRCVLGARGTARSASAGGAGRHRRKGAVRSVPDHRPVVWVARAVPRAPCRRPGGCWAVPCGGRCVLGARGTARLAPAGVRVVSVRRGLFGSCRTTGGWWAGRAVPRAPKKRSPPCARAPPHGCAVTRRRTATTSGARGTARSAPAGVRVVSVRRGLFGPCRTTGRWGVARAVPRAPENARPRGSRAPPESARLCGRRQAIRGAGNCALSPHRGCGVSPARRGWPQAGGG
jgi:hypothetical protein